MSYNYLVVRNSIKQITFIKINNQTLNEKQIEIEIKSKHQTIEERFNVQKDKRIV